jgi:hypothetical protein
MGAEEGRRRHNHVGEPTAGERLEAADHRHDADQPYPLRLGQARVLGATRTHRGRHRDDHLIAGSQPEPLGERISGDRLVDRSGIGEPAPQDLRQMGDAFAVVGGDEEDVRERHRVAAPGKGRGEQARPGGRHDLRKACDLVEDLICLRT